MKNPYCATLILPLVRIVGVAVREDTLAVDLEDGGSVAVPIGWFPRLAYASMVDRDNFVIGGAGYGIHWPDLDEDVGVEGLLLGKKSGESQASFERWLQRRRADKQGGVGGWMTSQETKASSSST